MKTFSIIKELSTETELLDKKIEKGYVFRIMGGKLNEEGLFAWREKIDESKFMVSQFGNKAENYYLEKSKIFTCDNNLSNMLLTHFIESEIIVNVLGSESFEDRQYQHELMCLKSLGTVDKIPVYKVSEQLVNCLKETEIPEGILIPEEFLDGISKKIIPSVGVFVFDKPFTISTMWGEESAKYATFYQYQTESGELYFSTQLYFQIANFNCYRPLSKVGLEPKNNYYNIDNWDEKNKFLQSQYLNIIEKIFITLALNNGTLVRLPKGNKPGLLHTDFEMIPGEGNGNKKIQHWRRGHIRRQWYGKKGQQHQDAIWIKPTLINSK